MSEIVHWEQMEDFDLETALRLMAQITMGNFLWDHWAKCKQFERLLAQNEHLNASYNDACVRLLEKNQTIADLRNAVAQEPQRRNGVLQGTVQHLKGQLKVVEDELDKAHAVIQTWSDANAKLEVEMIELYERNERLKGVEE